MTEVSGWLLDLYEDPRQGACMWHIGDDGKRRRFHQKFPATFYAAGKELHLQKLCEILVGNSLPADISRTERFDLFARSLVPVLAITIPNVYDLPRCFRLIEKALPDLTYYDADVPLSLRHAAAHKTFPLARCQIQAAEDGQVNTLEMLDTPWDIDPQPAPLRIMRLEPDQNPQHAAPRFLTVTCGGASCRLALEPARALLINLRALLSRHDPDILLTSWGDTWLLPLLVRLAAKHLIDLPLNRDAGRGLAYQAERSYFSYGQVIYQGSQIYLFGRLHLDQCNAMFWKDCSLNGTLETARVTRLPIQQAARRSPGTGISSMQIVKALENNVLVPYQKQQAEHPKTALDLLQSDLGGLVCQPIVGVHTNVGELDFMSMYPSIMVRCNISPETNASKNLGLSSEPPGLIPQTLAPLLEKRLGLKKTMAGLPRWDTRRAAYKQRIAAQKWLLVTCFGYLGYKNARFGRIEAHEAITANGREALLRAKEAAEDQGFDVLHMYVDGLWLHRPGAQTPEAFQPLLDEITRRTMLPVALDGIYRWVVFLPSRLDTRVPVANRYFGVFQDGSIKTRGIESRRRDTPAFIAQVQMEILEYLAQWEYSQISKYIPGALAILRKRLKQLLSRQVPPQDLLLAQRLSRELAAYRSPSPAARAAFQLKSIGKVVKPGQRVQFLFTLGKDGVFAWDLLEKYPDYGRIDLKHYQVLLLRAAETILEPFGWRQEALQSITGSIPAVQRPIGLDYYSSWSRR
jgi:DNA polymerase II